MSTCLHRGQELTALIEAAFKIKGDHAGVAVALALDQFVLRVAGQPGVQH
jgi:hypothetical protein